MFCILIEKKHTMKKRFNLVMLITNLAFSTAIFSQDSHGIVHYEYKEDMAGKVTFQTSNGSEALDQNIMQKIQKSFEKTFELRFNQTEAIYQEFQKVTMKDGSGNATFDRLYSNLSKKVLIEEVENEWDSRKYLVKDSLSRYNWTLENSTKTIGDYICYKAISVVKVSDKDVADYENQISKNNLKSISLLSIDPPKDKTIIAWYTPEIPVSHGPEKYQGLPRLILEVNDDGAVWSCSKLILNPLKKTIVKIPTKGKMIFKKEYDILVEKQLEKMKDEDGVIQLQILED